MIVHGESPCIYARISVYVEIDTHILVDSIALHAHHILYYIGRHTSESPRVYIYQSLNL